MAKNKDEHIEPDNNSEEVSGELDETMPVGEDGDDAIVDEETLSNNNKMYYTAERGYSTNRLEDVYRPEDHYENQRMRVELVVAFDKLIDANPQYLYLRSIDITKVKAGDDIYVDIDTSSYNVLPKPTNFVFCKILSRNKATYEVIDESTGKKYNADVSHLKSIDEYISRLKATDIAFIYVNIRKYMTTINSEVDYFDVFSTYFRINEKILYNSLPEKVQNTLLVELDVKTGVFEKKDINPMW